MAAFYGAAGSSVVRQAGTPRTLKPFCRQIQVGTVACSGTVLMAVYRPDVALLRRQVTSLMEQTLRDWQCFVAIDGPDADARAVLVDLVGADPRFHVMEHAENLGHYRNFERLTELVPDDAAWVAYCDQDDRWYPQKLEMLVSELDRDPGRTAVTGSARIVDDAGTVLGMSRRTPASVGRLLLRNELTGSFTVFRSDVPRLALPFPPETRIAVHDHWLAVCAASIGEVVFLDELVQDYVQHQGNAIGEPTPSLLRSLREFAGAPSRRAHLEFMSREKWGWRVSMARTLLPRLEGRGLRLSPVVAAVAEGGMSPALPKLLFNEVRSEGLPARTGLAMGAAALWWPRLKEPSHRHRAGRSRSGRGQ